MCIFPEHRCIDRLSFPGQVVCFSNIFPSKSDRRKHTAGLSGSAPIACGGGSVSDLFSERDRASAMAVYSLGPLIGMSPCPTPWVRLHEIFINRTRCGTHSWRFYFRVNRDEIYLRRYSRLLRNCRLGWYSVTAGDLRACYPSSDGQEFVGSREGS